MPDPNFKKEVGEGSRWKKGQSGNPAGRPKGRRNTKNILQDIFDTLQKGEHPIKNEECTLPVIEWMCLVQIASALNGDLSAFKALVERVEGQSIQNINHAGSFGIEKKVFITKEDVKETDSHIDESIQ